MCENVVKSRVMPLHKAKKAFSKEEKGEGMLLNYPISCNFAVNEKNVHLAYWFHVAHRGGMLCTDKVDARDITDGTPARFHTLCLQSRWNRGK